MDNTMAQIEAALDAYGIAYMDEHNECRYGSSASVRKAQDVLREKEKALVALIRSALAAQPGQGEKYGWPVREDFDASKGRYEKCDACWGYPTKPGQDQCRKCAGMGGHLYYPAVTPLTPAHDEAGVRAEWQPLDTAPKDGTHILIAWKGSNADLWHTTIGYWRTHHGDYEKDTHKHWAMVRVTDPSLTSMGPEEIRDWVRWMPLPNPPGYRAALLGETK